MRTLDIASFESRQRISLAHQNHHEAIVATAILLGWTDISEEDPHPQAGGAAPYRGLPVRNGNVLTGKAPGAKDWRNADGIGGYMSSVIPPDLHRLVGTVAENASNNCSELSIVPIRNRILYSSSVVLVDGVNCVNPITGSDTGFNLWITITKHIDLVYGLTTRLAINPMLMTGGPYRNVSQLPQAGAEVHELCA